MKQCSGTRSAAFRHGNTEFYYMDFSNFEGRTMFVVPNFSGDTATFLNFVIST